MLHSSGGLDCSDTNESCNHPQELSSTDECGKNHKNGTEDVKQEDGQPNVKMERTKREVARKEKFEKAMEIAMKKVAKMNEECYRLTAVCVHH